ncbi:MAG: hypothetical protein QXF07_02660 [Candidatus Micrarchaeia archaeon]
MEKIEERRTCVPKVYKLIKDVKKAAVAVTIFANMLLPPSRLNSQGNVDISLVSGGKHENTTITSYVKIAGNYDLPLEIKGSTILKLLNEKKGYIGKTTLVKNIRKNVIGIRTNIMQYNEIFSQLGIGINTTIQPTKKVSLNISMLPIWYDGKNLIKDKLTIEYFVKFKLPLNISASCFGEWNVADIRNIKWITGEINISKQLGNLKLNYNPALVADGDATPIYLHRIGIEIPFK